MAPLKAVKTDRDMRAQNIIELAKRTSASLQRRDDPFPRDLGSELESTINRSFPIPSGAAAPSRSELDSRGCEIWNAATNILRAPETGIRQGSSLQGPTDRFVLLLRVFASLLIDAAYHAAPKRPQDAQQRIRCFKTVLKASKFCLEKGELDFALRVLERCAEHVSACEQDSPMVQISRSSEENGDKASFRSCVTEYYLLRFTHAWKSERLDLAEHFFQRGPVSQISETPRLAEKAAEVFCEAGRTLLTKSLDDEAAKWLDRAMVILNQLEGDIQSHEVLELRLSVSLSLVECWLRSRAIDSLQKAQALVEQLCSIYGFASRLSVQLMQLQIILKQQPIPLEQLRDTIFRIVRSTVLTDKTFTLIMQLIHLVKKTDITVACDALAELLRNRLLRNYSEPCDTGDQTQIRLEQVIVTYALFTTSNEGTTEKDKIESLQRVLDDIDRFQIRLSPKATHAAQTLLWKAAGAPGHENASSWCKALQHPIFESAGHANKAKIGRKAMMIAMAEKDFDAARAVFFQMPDTSKNESLTRYLSFKLALSCNDYPMAEESLQQIVRQAKKDHSFLYACVLEAQQSDMRSIAVAALRAIVDNRASDAHLPSLLRCTARLLIGELKSPDRDPQQVMEEIVNVLVNAAGSLQALKKAAGEQWRDEVQWWSKNAYNLALQHCADMQLEHLARLLEVCVTFIESDQCDDGGRDQGRLIKRKALCHFLSATAHVSLARSSGERSEEGLQSYLHARTQITAFKSTHARIAGDDRIDLNKKALELWKFDLECILHLQQWDQLDIALQTCLEHKDVDRWDTLADIVLIIRQHPDIAASKTDAETSMNKLLDRIINETWQKDRDITKASRWLRLSFSMDVKNGSGEFALQLLKQAANMAKKGQNKDGGMYPETELQWLAITAFNKAIDLLSSGEMDGADKWIQEALELARYAADNGALHANLTDREEQVMQRWRQMRM